ncbi:hypothetical protein CSOJ01_01216 [Colletotrichum sojae]|uniref:Uncharacterized protein n=1 Tax=Colletotrichum sojae TaxID=2175907 RepID=A0A8H6JUX5_9PEZI|nr:hypothetical protein CSOJ01_01216 [Colletotrichum sojae]
MTSSSSYSRQRAATCSPAAAPRRPRTAQTTPPLVIHEKRVSGGGPGAIFCPFVQHGVECKPQGRLCGIDSASPETCVVVRSGPEGGKATTAQSCGQVSGGRRVRRDSSRRRRRRRRIPGWLSVNVAASDMLFDSRLLVEALGKAPLEE